MLLGVRDCIFMEANEDGVSKLHSVPAADIPELLVVMHVGSMWGQ